MNYLQQLATDEKPIAVLTRKTGYVRADIYFAPGDTDTMDVATTDLDEALKKVLDHYDAESTGEETSLQQGATAHPGQRAWHLKLK